MGLILRLLLVPSGKSSCVNDWKWKVKAEQASVAEIILRSWSLPFNICNQFVWTKCSMGIKDVNLHSNLTLYIQD